MRHEVGGSPPRRRFFLNIDAIENALQIYVKGKESNMRKPRKSKCVDDTNQFAATPQIEMRQPHKSIYKESENTTENTTETSTNVEGATPPLVPKEGGKNHPAKYGNADVNAVLDYLRAVIGLTDFAEPVSEQRKWATHIARLGKAIGSEEFQTRLQALLDDPFKRKKLNKTAGIYYEIKGFIPEKLPGVNIS